MSFPHAPISALAGLTKPDGETGLDPTKCSPFEIIHAAMRQDPELQENGWRFYDHEKFLRGAHVNHESEWVGAVAAHFGTKLLSMTPQQICDAYKKVRNVAKTLNHGRLISRDTIQAIVGQTLWQQRVEEEPAEADLDWAAA